MIIYLSSQQEESVSAPSQQEESVSAPSQQEESVSAPSQQEESVSAPSQQEELVPAFSQKNPLISVVIPLYNAQEYIGECLDSVLAQTFQDYEVIVVDDCSTDDSVKIVKNYAQKFNGRLKLAHTEKNSGGGGYIPRNVGLTLSRGEYVYFMDADDLILLTALETMYTAAKENDADVVYTAIFYKMTQANEIEKVIDGEGNLLLSKKLEDKPVLTVGSNDKNLQLALTKAHSRTPWIKFLRRNFLLENKIVFPTISVGGDAIWTIAIYAHAKRFLRLPQPVYFYRFYNENSHIHKKRSSKEQIVYWSSGFMAWVNSFSKLISEIEFMKKNPVLSYRALKDYFHFALIKSIDLINAKETYKALFEKFTNENTNTVPSLILPFFFTFAREESRRLLKIDKFKPYLTARIDIRLITEANQSKFKIFSVSDNRAQIIPSSHFKEGDLVYQIHSYVGQLEFITKTTADGQIYLNLRGLDIRDSKDKSKRMPYWIDYTKLTVNDNVIFDKLIPTWHDKPYRYNFNVKADEEVKIQVEWLPHRSDT